MKNRAYPYLTLALFGLALLAALPASAQELNPGGNQSAALDLASLTKAACHGTVSCQPTYGACAGWSGYSDCDDLLPQCRPTFRCPEMYCDEWGFCYWLAGPTWERRVERFRVCFDPWGNSCTEWEQARNITCGC